MSETYDEDGWEARGTFYKAVDTPSPASSLMSKTRRNKQMNNIVKTMTKIVDGEAVEFSTYNVLYASPLAETWWADLKREILNNPDYYRQRNDDYPSRGKNFGNDNDGD